MIVLFRWLNKSNVNTKALDIYSVVEEAIRSGAQDYMFQINEIRDVNQDNNEENLQNVIKVTQLVRADLQRGLEFYDKLFKEYAYFVFTLIYTLYRICSLLLPINQSIFSISVASNATIRQSATYTMRKSYRRVFK